MKNEEVKILVQKYFDGETTLVEERLLRDYFRQGAVPEELMPYRAWFAGLAADEPLWMMPEEEVTPGAGTGGFTAAGREEASVHGDGKPFTAAEVAALIAEQERHKRVRSRSLRYTLTGIAASLLVAVGAMLWYERQPAYRDTFEDPEQALAVAGETLAFVSEKYNKGLEELAVMQKIPAAVEPARENLAILQRGFSKAELFRNDPEQP